MTLVQRSRITSATSTTSLFHHQRVQRKGVILKLPPIKQALASKQMKSRYLEAIIKRLNV